MDTKNLSVPPHAQARITGKNHPHRRLKSGVSGVVHDNVRHTSRFTVIGNHLAQHPELSLLAIGLAVHIQSLPTGALVDIKTLARRFPEGPDRIAAALRDLVTHGYLSRTRERTPTGNIVTRTVSCNQPGRHTEDRPDRRTEPEPTPMPEPEPTPTPAPMPAPMPAPESEPEREPTRASEPAPGPGRPTHHAPAPGPQPDRSTRPGHPTAPAPPKKRTPRKPLPAVPQPAYKGPGLLQAATDVLAGLRHHPGLLLSACDTVHLAPGVAAWLERDVSPTAVRHALASDLPPEGLRRPAAFLAHRLAAQLPPLPPFHAPASPPDIRHPLQNCGGCERAFRAPEPGRCRDCRSDLLEPA